MTCVIFLLNRRMSASCVTLDGLSTHLPGEKPTVALSIMSALKSYKATLMTLVLIYGL
jgi:hypothetical protein